LVSVGTRHCQFRVQVRPFGRWHSDRTDDGALTERAMALPSVRGLGAQGRISSRGPGPRRGVAAPSRVWVRACRPAGHRCSCGRRGPVGLAEPAWDEVPDERLPGSDAGQGLPGQGQGPGAVRHRGRWPAWNQAGPDPVHRTGAHPPAPEYESKCHRRHIITWLDKGTTRRAGISDLTSGVSAG
jgi:hypothetical protein